MDKTINNFCCGSFEPILADVDTIEYNVELIPLIVMNRVTSKCFYKFSFLWDNITFFCDLEF
jgi:hypothetical protein